MTRDETRRLIAAVRVLWPHSKVLPEGVPAGDAVDMWAAMLADVPYPDADGAVRELAATGRDQSPPIGLILRTATDRALGVPAWDIVWPELDAKARECVTVRGFRVPAVAEFSHPHVGKFAREHWRMICPPPREEAMATHRAQLRDMYRSGSGRVERDGALEAVRAPRVSGGPRRLDPGTVG